MKFFRDATKKLAKLGKLFKIFQRGVGKFFKFSGKYTPLGKGSPSGVKSISVVGLDLIRLDDKYDVWTSASPRLFRCGCVVSEVVG